MKIGVTIPSYNEKESIAQLVLEIQKYVPGCLILVVDDSPTDQTAEVLRPLLNDSVQLIRRKTKGGRGSAVIEGIRNLVDRGANVIVEMDADFSHPPSQIPELVQELKSQNLDLLIASRYLDQSKILNWPLSRRLFSFFSNKLARFVLRVPVCDYTNGFRCYSRAAAEVIVGTCGKLGKGFISLSEILVNLYYRGQKISEVPTVFVNRVRGESSLNSAEITNAVKGLVQIHALKNQLLKDSYEAMAKKHS